MINRRSLIAGLGALFTIPFLPKLSQGKEYFEGREVIRVELDKPTFIYTRANGAIGFCDMPRRPHLFTRKDARPEIAKAMYLNKDNYEKGCRYIYLVTCGEYGTIITSYSGDIQFQTAKDGWFNISFIAKS